MLLLVAQLLLESLAAALWQHRQRVFDSKAARCGRRSRHRLRTLQAGHCLLELLQAQARLRAAAAPLPLRLRPTSRATILIAAPAPAPACVPATAAALIPVSPRLQI